MAVTRATGKAFRLTFSFLAALAGLEATPAEEMPGDYEPPQQRSEQVADVVEAKAVDRQQSKPTASNGTLGPARAKGLMDQLGKFDITLAELREGLEALVGSTPENPADFPDTWAEDIKETIRGIQARREQEAAAEAQPHDDWAVDTKGDPREASKS